MWCKRNKCCGRKWRPELSTMDKVFIYEVACSSGVQKHLDGMHLTSVSGTDLYRKDDRHSMGIKGIGGVIWVVSFPISASETGLSCPE